MDSFPYECLKYWPYEWTYTQIDLTSIDDRNWLSKNVGPFGKSWIFMAAHRPGLLCTRYGFVNKEDMILFLLTRCNTDEQ